MPTYSYHCDKCKSDFEIFFYIKDYIENPICTLCSSKKTHRSLVKDALTLNSSVKKSDNELKTIGDLARRNTDRMSEDQKIALYQKHNAYKEDTSTKQLPSGMKRIQKPQKIKWPGAMTKTKRKPKHG
jgi:putative FmdB family regulatory protein